MYTHTLTLSLKMVYPEREKDKKGCRAWGGWWVVGSWLCTAEGPTLPGHGRLGPGGRGEWELPSVHQEAAVPRLVLF